MSTVFFCIYAVVTLVGIVFFGLRELHMLQLNGYKTPEHSWWMKKYISACSFCGTIPHACNGLQYTFIDSFYYL